MTGTPSKSGPGSRRARIQRGLLSANGGWYCQRRRSRGMVVPARQKSSHLPSTVGKALATTGRAEIASDARRAQVGREFRESVLGRR
jgi:hypothetical protein